MPSGIISVVGRLTKDVERANEKAPYKTSIALDNALRKGKNRETKFLQIDIWSNTPAGQMIERMAGKGKSLTKGALIHVSGAPTWEEYTKSDGGIGYRDGIDASIIEFVSVGTKQTSTSDSGSTTTSQSTIGAGGLELEDDITL